MNIQKNIAVLLFFFISISAQEQKVYGLIDNGDEKFLITAEGFVKASNDAYLEYYRSIYNDSTLANPNKVINSKSVRIIPIINPKDWSNLNFEIAPQVYFYDFMDYDSVGTIIINPDISQYLQNYGNWNNQNVR